jgi:hypothetical protein
VPLDVKTLNTVASEIGVEATRSLLEPFVRHYRWFVESEVPEKARTKVPVKKIMLETILETAEAPIARTVALGRARLQEIDGIVEHGSAEFPDTAGKPRTSSERVVDVDLGLETLVATLRERRPILGLQLASFHLEATRGCDGDRLGKGPQSNIRSEEPGTKDQWRLDAQGHEEDIGDEVCSKHQASGGG